MKNKMRKIYDFRRAVASILSLLLFLLCGVTATAQNPGNQRNGTG